MGHGVKEEMTFETYVPPVEAPDPSTQRRWAVSIDAVLGPLIEIPAALLVGVEVWVLLAGVTSRYLFHNPLVWSDELASMLFLWLAMLGAVVALRRGEHMRMTALVSKTSRGARAFLDILAIVAALTFLVLIAAPAYDF